jgi:hypothetical protein
MRTGPTLHSVPLQTLLCLHSDDPRRHAACAPPVGFRRVGAPQPLQKPTGVQHGCGARSPARLPNVLRFTGAAKRSGAASGAGAGWARARAGYSEYTDTSTWRVAWRRPRRLSSIVLSTFAA